jgi:ketosteroid isomerase-like protein
MASETEARIRAIYAGPFDVETYHPEIEWHLRADLPDSATLRGREEVARNAAGWLEAFDDLVLEPVEVSEAAGKIIVVVHVHGSIKGTGEKVDMDEVHVLTERDGKLIEIREYLTRDEAFRSLGLAV